MEQVQLLIKNAKVFNSYLKKFISANVAVKDGKFYYIDRKQDTDLQTDNVIDAKGSYMIPGLTDIHMHIESSMATPAFWKMCRRKWCDDGGFRASRNGQCQRDPRILEMISAAKNAPIDIFTGFQAAFRQPVKSWKQQAGSLTAVQ